MIQNFDINSKQIDKIKKITSEEKNFRVKNLELFKAAGFPNKKIEDWKFSDLKNIISKNFNKLDVKKVKSNINKINLLQDFEHNFILLVNGTLQSSSFEHENKKKIKLTPNSNDINYKTSANPLVCLNHALSENGYSLEIEKDYKFKKILVIYNFFTKDLKNKILNSKNKIRIKENSEMHIIEYTINESKFINNVYENIDLEKDSKLKNIYIQSKKSEGYFHKFLKNKLYSNSDYTRNIIRELGSSFHTFTIFLACVVYKNDR